MEHLIDYKKDGRLLTEGTWWAAKNIEALWGLGGLLLLTSTSEFQHRQGKKSTMISTPHPSLRQVFRHARLFTTPGLSPLPAFQHIFGVFADQYAVKTVKLFSFFFQFFLLLCDCTSDNHFLATLRSLPARKKEKEKKMQNKNLAKKKGLHIICWDEHNVPIIITFLSHLAKYESTVEMKWNLSYDHSYFSGLANKWRYFYTTKKGKEKIKEFCFLLFDLFFLKDFTGVIKFIHTN